MRILHVGDIVYQNQKKTTYLLNSNVLIHRIDGKDMTMLGKDTLTLDQSTSNNESFGNETITDIFALQQAILKGIDLDALKETAAGGGEGISLSSANFTQGGHSSNVNANVGNINPLSTVNADLGNINLVATARGAESNFSVIKAQENDLDIARGDNANEETAATLPIATINVSVVQDAMKGGEGMLYRQYEPSASRPTSIIDYMEDRESMVYDRCIEGTPIDGSEYAVYKLNLSGAVTNKPTTLNFNISGGVAGKDYDANTMQYSTDGGATWINGSRATLNNANDINNILVRVKSIDNDGHDGVDLATNPTAQSFNQNQGTAISSNYHDGLDFKSYRRELTLNVTTDNAELASGSAKGGIIDRDNYVNMTKGIVISIFTGHGDDTVNMNGNFNDFRHAITGYGRVLNVETGDGNDVVNVKSGSIIYGYGRIILGNGNDIFNMNGEIKGGLIYGENGNDTFS